MRFYSIGYLEALELPLKTFWMMSNNVNRISAEEDIRAMSRTAAASSEEGFSKAQERLQAEMGRVFVGSEEEEQRLGIERLRKLQRAMTNGS